MSQVKTGDDCSQCGHPFDPHSLIATTGNPMEGGVILCPDKGCECYSTWSPQGAPVKRIPDRFELEVLREQIQS